MGGSTPAELHSLGSPLIDTASQKIRQPRTKYREVDKLAKTEVVSLLPPSPTLT